jgi:hypothetical protein
VCRVGRSPLLPECLQQLRLHRSRHSFRRYVVTVPSNLPELRQMVPTGSAFRKVTIDPLPPPRRQGIIQVFRESLPRSAAAGALGHRWNAGFWSGSAHLPAMNVASTSVHRTLADAPPPADDPRRPNQPFSRGRIRSGPSPSEARARPPRSPPPHGIREGGRPRCRFPPPSVGRSNRRRAAR